MMLNFQNILGLERRVPHGNYKEILLVAAVTTQITLAKVSVWKVYLPTAANANKLFPC